MDDLIKMKIKDEFMKHMLSQIEIRLKDTIKVLKYFES